MKKIYSKPEVNVVVMEIKNHLMEASGTGIKGDAPEGVGGLSRKGGFWDDEDEEEL